MYDKTIKISIITNTNNSIQSPQIISTKSKTVSKTTIEPSPQPTTSSQQAIIDREVDDTRESIDIMSATTTTPTLDTRAANEAETNNNSEILSPETPRFSQFMDYITGSATSETAQADTETSSQSATGQPSLIGKTMNTSTNNTSYDKTNYQYKNRYATLTNPNYTKSLNSKNKVGKRCYRLNIERPFDIHCEQSPLVRFVLVCFVVVCLCALTLARSLTNLPLFSSSLYILNRSMVITWHHGQRKYIPKLSVQPNIVHHVTWVVNKLHGEN